MQIIFLGAHIVCPQNWGTDKALKLKVERKEAHTYRRGAVEPLKGAEFVLERRNLLRFSDFPA